jgi:lipopolysaccharide transport system ATP-binding protein
MHLENCLHWLDYACNFEVAGLLGDIFTGICRLEPKIDLLKIDK